MLKTQTVRQYFTGVPSGPEQMGRDVAPADPVPVKLVPHPGNNRPKISDEINTATRQVHTRLNKLITSHIPLALPPYTSSPTTFSNGLSYLAPFYYTFESVWAKFIAQEPSNNLNLSLSDFLTQISPLDSRIRDILSILYLPSLLRSSSLRRDTRQYGTARGHSSTSPNPLSRRIDALQREISASIILKPHVLIAYAWIMYMALFAGGRWIREQLLSPGETFWAVPNDQLPGREAKDEEEYTPVSFLRFPDSVDDGNDIKAEFKSRLAEIEPLLTPEERSDIVDEGKRIFAYLLEVVEEIGPAMLSDGEEGPTVVDIGEKSRQKPGSLRGSPLLPVSSLRRAPASFWLAPLVLLQRCQPLHQLAFLLGIVALVVLYR